MSHLTLSTFLKIKLLHNLEPDGRYVQLASIRYKIPHVPETLYAYVHLLEREEEAVPVALRQEPVHQRDVVHPVLGQRWLGSNEFLKVSRAWEIVATGCHIGEIIDPDACALACRLRERAVQCQVTH